MANTLRFKRGLVSGIPTALAGEPLFTTDTFDLYIGNGTTNTRFQKYIASGTTSQLLRGDGSLLTMPIVLTSPSSGQVLKFNGTNWVNDSDAGITGSGTTNYLPKFTGASTLGDSLLQEATRAIGLNVTPSAWGISDWRALQINFGYLVANSASFIEMGANAYNDGTNYRYIAASQASTRYRQNTGSHEWHYSAVGSAGATITYTQAARITSTGNFIINNSTTDNGLRFQVTGDGYFSGSVGIGTTSLAGRSLSVSKNVTGNTDAFIIYNNGQIQTDVTASANYFYSVASTAASTTLTNLRHNLAVQGTFGAGSVITNQVGYFAHSSLIGATNNYGFYGDIASGTGRWNLYMSGTASNYLAGNLSIGTTTSTYGLNLGGSTAASNIISSNSPANYSVIFSRINSANAWGIDNIAGNMQFYLTSYRGGFFSNGNFQIGNMASDTGQLLQVNGTMRVSGASTFGDNVTLNGGVITFGAGVSNSPYTNSSWIRGASGAGTFITNNGITAWLGLKSNGDLDYNGGFTILASTGAATFSSSVTATNLALDTTSANGSGRISLLSGGTRFGYIGTSLWALGEAGTDMTIVSVGGLRFATNNTSPTKLMLTTGGNLLIGTTTDAGYKLDVNGTMRVSGASTFSSSVTANSFAINTSGQSRTITTFYGSGSDGSNIFIGGGGLSSTTGGGAATNGSYNTTLGVNALLSNTTGYSNTVMGASSMVYNTTGLNNSAFGRSSLGDNTTGDDNTSVGLAALLTNTTGDGNTALGFQAGWGNGTNANTTGGNNIFIGNLSVGESASESNRTWIGNTSTASTWVGGNLLVGTRTNGSYKADINGTLRATQFNLSALNTAPATSSSTGTLGEIRIDADHIYVCTATNTWKRVAISTF